VGERESDRMGGGIRGEMIVRGPVSECEREREKGKRRVKTVRKKERESLHGAQESSTLRNGERQRKNYGEIESEEK